MLLSKCISPARREKLEKDVEQLKGKVVVDDSFTHFVTLAPRRGDSNRGFVRSLNLLIALAAGTAQAILRLQLV